MDTLDGVKFATLDGERTPMMIVISHIPNNEWHYMAPEMNNILLYGHPELSPILASLIVGQTAGVGTQI